MGLPAVAVVPILAIMLQGRLIETKPAAGEDAEATITSA
jgi:hypothetical protein